MKLTKSIEKMHGEPVLQIVLRDEDWRIIAECGASTDETFQAEADEIVRAVNNADALAEALESLKHLINNPSAWEHYDESVSEKLRAAVIPALAAYRGEQ